MSRAAFSLVLVLAWLSQLVQAVDETLVSGDYDCGNGCDYAGYQIEFAEGSDFSLTCSKNSACMGSTIVVNPLCTLRDTGIVCGANSACKNAIIQVDSSDLMTDTMGVLQCGPVANACDSMDLMLDGDSQLGLLCSTDACPNMAVYLFGTSTLALENGTSFDASNPTTIYVCEDSELIDDEAVDGYVLGECPTTTETPTSTTETPTSTTETPTSTTETPTSTTKTPTSTTETPSTTLQPTSSSIPPTTTTSMPTTTMSLPTTTTKAPTTTTQFPSTTVTPTTTELPTTTTETPTTVPPTSTTKTPTLTPTTTTPEPMFVCDDGCAIVDNYFDDDWCDCSNCEDEPNWECDSCGTDGCPVTCGGYVQCFRVTTTTLKPTTTTETPTSTTETPTTTTKTPTTTTETPTTTTETPTSTTETPTSTTATPTSTTETPTTTTETPTATTETPTSTTETPTSTTETPTSTTEKPTSTVQPTTEKPSTELPVSTRVTTTEESSGGGGGSQGSDTGAQLLALFYGLLIGVGVVFVLTGAYIVLFTEDGRKWVKERWDDLNQWNVSGEQVIKIEMKPTQKRVTSLSYLDEGNLVTTAPDAASDDAMVYATVQEEEQEYQYNAADYQYEAAHGYEAGHGFEAAHGYDAGHGYEADHGYEAGAGHEYEADNLEYGNRFSEAELELENEEKEVEYVTPGGTGLADMKESDDWSSSDEHSSSRHEGQHFGDDRSSTEEEVVLRVQTVAEAASFEE